MLFIQKCASDWPNRTRLSENSLIELKVVRINQSNAFPPEQLIPGLNKHFNDNKCPHKDRNVFVVFLLFQALQSFNTFVCWQILNSREFNLQQVTWGALACDSNCHRLAFLAYLALSSVVERSPALSSIAQVCPALSSVVQVCLAFSSVIQCCPTLSNIVQRCPALPSVLQRLWIIFSKHNSR